MKNLAAILAISSALAACTTIDPTAPKTTTLQDVCTAEQITKQPKMCKRMLADKQYGVALYPDAIIPSVGGVGAGTAANY